MPNLTRHSSFPCRRAGTLICLVPLLIVVACADKEESPPASGPAAPQEFPLAFFVGQWRVTSFIYNDTQQSENFSDLTYTFKKDPNNPGAGSVRVTDGIHFDEVAFNYSSATSSVAAAFSADLNPPGQGRYLLPPEYDFTKVGDKADHFLLAGIFNGPPTIRSLFAFQRL